jgi:3-deoxy-D-manno-octulosonic acid kinase
MFWVTVNGMTRPQATAIADDRPTEKPTLNMGSKLSIQRVDRSCSIFRLSATPKALTQQWFDPGYWDAQHKTVDRRFGRSTAYFFEENDVTHVLRHYWRGGVIGKFIRDSYLFTGIRRSRVYRELELLSTLDEMQLPIGKPIAAILTRHGLFYRGSVITQAIPSSFNLLEILRQRELTDTEIVAVARMLANFHRKGVDHADLNIGNVLLDTDGQPYLVDFDRGRIRKPNPSWQRTNIRRLERSFTKQKHLNPGLLWTVDHWQLLMTTYRAEMAG